MKSLSHIISYFVLLVFLLLINQPIQAQNNPIFNGGIADGFGSACFLIATNNPLFGGGIEDGFSQSSFIPETNNALFTGGNSDGFSLSCYLIPSQNSIFSGAEGDGFDQACFVMVSQNSIFSGGIADGFDEACFASPASNDIFSGGIADGYTAACFYHNSNNLIYAGGVGDGFDLFQVLQSPVFPVELLSFDGIYVDGESWLNWVTTNEVNNSHFELQRSVDGNIFERIATLQGMGNSTEINGYEYIDPVAHLANDYEVLYYRLKQVDLDGTFQLSRIVSIHLEPFQNSVYAYPNPTAETLFLRFRSTVSESIDVDIFNVQGSLIQELHFQPEPDRNTLKLDFPNLSEGIYYCRVHFGDAIHELTSIRFVILK